MKIARVSSWILRVPFRYPLLDHESTTLANLVEIETDDGHVGHAFSAYPMGFAVREIIESEITPAILGLDARNIEAVQERMLWSVATKFYTGVFSCAASLIDVALWDIKGKATGWPIWRLLGGARQTVPAYITFGLKQYSTEQLIEVAKTLISQGHTHLKMVVGDPLDNELPGERPTDSVVAHSANRVKALREAVGPDVNIYMDGNKNMTVHQAVWLAKLVEPYGLTWFEDPVINANPRLMAEVRHQTTIPIAAGSSGTTDMNALREFLLHNSVDYLQPNVRDIGGFTAGLKAAGMAQAFNIPISMGGNWPHMNMHLQAGVPHGGQVEFHWQGWQVGVMLFDGAQDPENNTVTLSDRPGLGYTPKEGIVQEYAID
jgi:L-rhamnonate dehydratase